MSTKYSNQVNTLQREVRNDSNSTILMHEFQLNQETFGPKYTCYQQNLTGQSNISGHNGNQSGDDSWESFKEFVPSCERLSGEQSQNSGEEEVDPFLHDLRKRNKLRAKKILNIAQNNGLSIWPFEVLAENTSPDDSINLTPGAEIIAGHPSNYIENNHPYGQQVQQYQQLLDINKQMMTSQNQPHPQSIHQYPQPSFSNASTYPSKSTPRVGLMTQTSVQKTSLFKFFSQGYDYDMKNWYYKDHQNQVRGPFSSREMDAWHDARYLPLDLPITYGENQHYRLLADLIKYKEAFDTPNSYSKPIPTNSNPSQERKLKKQYYDPRSANRHNANSLENQGYYRLDNQSIANKMKSRINPSAKESSRVQPTGLKTQEFPTFVVADGFKSYATYAESKNNTSFEFKTYDE